MKFTLAVTAFVGLIGRCSDFPIDPPGHGHHPPPPAADDDAGVEDESCQPEQFGLYADRYCKRLAKGVIPFTPRYELWADGADKQRYIYLPEGAQIDTSNPDRWSFPRGTRIYKTFSLDGLKLETRRFEKTGDGTGIEHWTYDAYAWSADQRKLTLAQDGAENVLGTEHDIPSRNQCKSCHDQSTRREQPSDIVNGFAAIQLNHEGRGWTLESLIRQDRLVNSQGTAPNVTLENAHAPGARSEQAALGYLHSNCGNCHVGVSPPQGLNLSLVLSSSEAPATALAYDAVCRSLMRWTGRKNPVSGEDYVVAIAPGSAAHSGIVGRMIATDVENRMPRVGRELSDEAGIEAVSRWIDALDQEDCPAPPPPPTPTP